jgi:catechol 2,3-dioxygenase-like lactoylglutathione lyase family enzyme
VLTGFNHLTLAVSDLSRSFDFYSRLLNFKPQAIWDRGAYLSLGELWLCLSLGPVEASASYTHFAFSIPQADFEAFRRRLLQGRVVEWQQDRSEGESCFLKGTDWHPRGGHVGSLGSRLAACRERPYEGMRFFD